MFLADGKSTCFHVFHTHLIQLETVFLFLLLWNRVEWNQDEVEWNQDEVEWNQDEVEWNQDRWNEIKMERMEPRMGQLGRGTLFRLASISNICMHATNNVIARGGGGSLGFEEPPLQTKNGPSRGPLECPLECTSEKFLSRMYKKVQSA